MEMSASDNLLAKIKHLNDSIWDRRVKEPQIKAWLSNFGNSANGNLDERTHGLYLLSQFVYFGTRQMRELMRVLFRDLYRYPIVEEIRRSNGDTTDLSLIEYRFNEVLKTTRFIGIGNPSESGYHLLYYFRQENGLPKTRFIHTHEVFKRSQHTKWQVIKSLLFKKSDRYGGTLKLRDAEVTRYVFIDDFCGSGHQGQSYSRETVEDIKALNPDIHISYFVLCGTSSGMDVIRTNTAFDDVKCVFELDNSFRCFFSASRYFPSPWPKEITRQFAEQTCRKYGAVLEPTIPLGYGDCQLLLAFQHNTPDNTLPIFWSEGSQSKAWTPIFKRYSKLYQ